MYDVRSESLYRPFLPAVVGIFHTATRLTYGVLIGGLVGIRGAP